MRPKLIISLITVFIILNVDTVFCKTINLVTSNIEPYHSELLIDQGVFVELSKEAFKRAGYDLKVTFTIWKKAMMMSLSGEYDGLLAAFYSKEREKIFYYTDDVMINKNVFICSKYNDDVYKNIYELKKYKIGAVRGSLQLTDLHNMGFQVKQFSGSKECMQSLLDNQIKFVVMEKLYFEYAIDNIFDLKEFKGKFKITGPIFKTYKMYNLINRKKINGRQITYKFNESLKQMKLDGTYAKILKSCKTVQ